MTGEDTHETRECPVCHAEVPAVGFCGDCGATFAAPTRQLQVLLRPGTFAASPTERVYVPGMSGTMFPRLPTRATHAYRIALVMLLVCMGVMSALQWNVPVATISVLGVPTLFLLYAWESDSFRDDRRESVRRVAPTMPGLVTSLVLGTIIGLAWWWFAGNLLSDKFGVTTAAAQALQNTLAEEGLFITLISELLMVLPLPLIRLVFKGDFDSLDGFVIGAAGATAHTTASYVVWWMPQIVAGLINENTTTGLRMLQDTILYGVVDPFTTIALGGMVGIALWFRPDPAGPAPGRARATVIVCAVLTAVLYAAVWFVDAEDWPRAAELAINLVLTALSLLVLRVGMQVALLHEVRDRGTGAPILCVYCEKVVPDMAFCPACGAATRASSLSARRLRRENPPVPVAG